MTLVPSLHDQSKAARKEEGDLPGLPSSTLSTSKTPTRPDPPLANSSVPPPCANPPFLPSSLLRGLASPLRGLASLRESIRLRPEGPAAPPDAVRGLRSDSSSSGLPASCRPAKTRGVRRSAVLLDREDSRMVDSPGSVAGSSGVLSWDSSGDIPPRTVSRDVCCAPLDCGNDPGPQL